MSTSLTPYTQLLPAARTTRALVRLSNETSLSVTVTQAKAEVEAAKIDGVATIAAKAISMASVVADAARRIGR